ncbi:hypothetical protein JCM16358_16260 [Halanaerocella petrolearia]
MSDGVEVQGCADGGIVDLLKGLEEDVDEVIVVVKSGGNCNVPRDRGPRAEDAEVECGGQRSRRRRQFCCCRHRGILCNVTRNFIVLIGDSKKTFIPIDAIAAIIKLD